MRRGNLGFGAISSGPISGTHAGAPPPPHPGVTKLSAYAVLNSSPAETAAGTTKLGAYAVLNASSGEDSAGTAKLAGYAVLNASVGETVVGAVKFGAYGVLNASLGEVSVGVTKFGAYGVAKTGADSFGITVTKFGAYAVYFLPPEQELPPKPRRLRIPVGMAEYTITAGIAPYEMRGALPNFATLRSQLIDREKIKYRATNGIQEEVGEGVFDWLGNKLIRFKAIIPETLVEWGSERKLLYVIEDYTRIPGGAGIIEGSTLSIGIAEYTTTTGTGSYDLRGPFPEFTSVRNQLVDQDRVSYRVTNGVLQEIGDGIVDWTTNQLIRTRLIDPAEAVDWPAGRKLVYIVIQR